MFGTRGEGAPLLSVSRNSLLRVLIPALVSTPPMLRIIMGLIPQLSPVPLAVAMHCG
jgi:hypothetical protein